MDIKKGLWNEAIFFVCSGLATHKLTVVQPVSCIDSNAPSLASLLVIAGAIHCHDRLQLQIT